jgi:hypothetical protein
MLSTTAPARGRGSRDHRGNRPARPPSSPARQSRRPDHGYRSQEACRDQAVRRTPHQDRQRRFTRARLLRPPHATNVPSSRRYERAERDRSGQPGDGSPPPATPAPTQDEHFDVRTGRLITVVDGVRRSAALATRFSWTPHKMSNAGAEAATAVWRTRPAGRTADWFRTVDRLGAGGARKPRLPGLAKGVD